MAASKMILCVAVCLGRVAAEQQDMPNFASFVQSFGRSYAASEYTERQSIYEKRVAAADSQNKKADKLWTAGVNEFWDWNQKEMTSLFGWVDGARPSGTSGGSKLSSIQKTDFLQKVNKTLPVEKSWNHLKSLQGVKSQGGCGSCWAVAAVTTLETATEINGNRRSFSAQELVNCVPNPKECGGQGGCRGATVELGMDWVMKYGAFEEYQAPYVGQDMVCNSPGAKALAVHQDKAGISFGMHGWETLPMNKMEPLMRALAETGPTAVSADASGWHMYSGGIFDGCVADAVVNHAIVATGYGQDTKGTMFWDITNSWGSTWGEKGHIKVLRRKDDDSQCGTDHHPEQGLGCKGGPSQVTVCGMCGILYDSVIVHLK